MRFINVKFKSNLPIRLTSNKTWEEKLIVDWDKVGLAMVTYNSEKRIKQSSFTVPDHIKHFYIVNDGTPYSKECYPANATILLKSSTEAFLFVIQSSILVILIGLLIRG